MSRSMATKPSSMDRTPWPWRPVFVDVTEAPSLGVTVMPSVIESECPRRSLAPSPTEFRNSGVLYNSPL